ELDAAGVVLEADERLGVREREWVVGDEHLPLEGVDDDERDRVAVRERDDRESCGPQPGATHLVVHAAVSFERAKRFWTRATTARMSRNSTALAWPTPSKPVRP